MILKDYTTMLSCMSSTMSEIQVPQKKCLKYKIEFKFTVFISYDESLLCSYFSLIYPLPYYI